MRLGITRSSDQLVMLQEGAADKGVDLISLPVIAIRPIEFEWPEDLDSRQIDWLFFTSGHGVRFFFERIKQLDIELNENIMIGVVGDKTAAALSNYGYAADFSPNEAYGRDLFEEFVEAIIPRGPSDREAVMYVRGQQTNFDPADLFKEAALNYWPLICYETEPRTVAPELVRQFSATDYILFTAPSAVDSYQDQFGRPLAKPLAIGRTTAAAMNHYGWSGFVTMKKAEVSKVLELMPWK